MIKSMVFKPAANVDLRRVPRLVTRFPDLVLLVGAAVPQCKLSDLVHGTFNVCYINRKQYFSSLLKSDNSKIWLQIVTFTVDKNILMWKKDDGRWCYNPPWAPYHQLLLPTHTVIDVAVAE